MLQLFLFNSKLTASGESSLLSQQLEQQPLPDHRYVRRKPYIYDLTEMANPPDLQLSNPRTYGVIFKKNGPNLFGRDYDISKTSLF